MGKHVRFCNSFDFFYILKISIIFITNNFKRYQENSILLKSSRSQSRYILKRLIALYRNKKIIAINNFDF